MIDIKKIRDDFEETAAQLARRGVEREAVKKAFDLDIKRRTLISRTEELKAKRNSASKEIGAKAKAGEDVAEAKAGNCLTFASGSFAFPANATLTLENTQAVNSDDKTYTLLKITGTGSFANLPRLTNDDLSPWILTLGNGGREIRLSFPRGTLMIFR